MRGLRSTIGLLVVLIGLGAYIYFVASKTEDTASKQERVFPQLASDDIEELTIRNGAGEVTTLEKEDGTWMMTVPTSTRASDMEASSITSALSGLEITRVVDENPAGLGEYGLDTPKAEVAFKAKGGKSGTLYIGNKTTTGGSIYARMGDGKRVVLVPEYNQTTFDKSTFDLRDKAIVTFDRTKVDGFDVVLPAGSFELAKKESQWTLVKPIVARADYSAADGLVTSVESLQMKSIVGPSATPEEMKRYGLDNPSAVVNLHLGTARTSVLLGGPAGEDTVYVKDVARPDIFTIQKAAADDLRKTANDYRQKDLFDMRAFNATRIEITRNGTMYAWDKVTGTGENAQDTWKRVSPTAAEPDKDKFQAFVAALADIRAIDFVDSKAKAEPPAATIVVKFDEGKKEDRVQMAKSGSDAYAARPDDPGAARIDTTKFDEAITSIDEFIK